MKQIKLIVFGISLLAVLVMPLGRIMTPVHASNPAKTQQEKRGNVERNLVATQEAQGAQVEVVTDLTNGADSITSQKSTSLATTTATYLEESETNNVAATAQPLTGAGIKVRGSIQPFSDVDFYSFSADAGDNVFAATMTSFSSDSQDTVLDVIASDGTTVLESDNDDGAFTGRSSSIAGAVIPATGIYYLKVRSNNAFPVLPYDLYFRLQKGAPTPQVEDGSVNPIPASGWVKGAIQNSNDVDVFSIPMNAGDTFYISLDGDPERDGVIWTPRMLLGPHTLFNSTTPVVSKANPAPNSLAYIMTVKQAGTYTILLDAGSTRPGDPTFTYQMSVSIYPASNRKCTSYTNATPVAIPSGPGSVTSTINIPDNVRISNLQVSLDVYHLSMPDLDVVLTSPTGNNVLLFVDRGTTGQFPNSSYSRMNVTLDDEAGINITSFPILYNMVMLPQTRLSWFNGESAAGTWTLKIYDDSANYDGTLNSWSLNVCEDTPLAPPASLTQTIYSSDFEANDGSFTHSGTFDEWELGTPSGASAPIANCNSGSNCWKTDLDNTYDINSSQDLLSPAIDLTSVKNRQVIASWAQKYQFERATYDHAFVEVREVANPSNSRRLWEWGDFTMQVTPASGLVGNPAVTIDESAGWGTREYDISDFAGKTVELRFHMDSDEGVELSGLAIDDVSVKASLVASRGDFDGNGLADLSVFRPSDGTWYTSANGNFMQQQFGAMTDKPVAADYDGDGDVDVAVWRPTDGNWYISKGSNQSFDQIQWGMNGDVPVPGDYDGDGKADQAVFRPGDGTWYIHRSSDGGFSAMQWGLSTDKPVQADYDGDGKTDIAVVRDGTWYILRSFTNTVTTVQWGFGTDLPVTGDYDGDRQFDIAVFRPSDGTWYILQSATKTLRAMQFGMSGDLPVPSDFDGDRKCDAAVFRPSEGSWYVLKTTDGTFFGAPWGQAGDVPTPSSGYVPE